jgi:UDP-N-acetylmuramoylalanine--D-glutamate ligase
MAPGVNEQRVSLCPARQLREILLNLSGKRVVLMGLGLFGGGEGAARFLVQRGARVTVSDVKTAQQLAPAIQRLSDLPIEYQLGSHDPDAVLKSELVIVNQAVPKTAPVLHECSRAGVPLSSAMNIFLTLCPAPVAAVTGSAGKSTTTAMLAAMLQAAGLHVRLGGNIGVSLLPVVQDIKAEEIVVLELSNFQLEDAAFLPWSPHVAVVTNIKPNHLDRHESFDDYVAAKKTIVDHQTKADAAVLNASDPILLEWVKQGIRSEVFFFDAAPQNGQLVRGMNLRNGRLIWNDSTGRHVICSRDHVSLPGEHNVANAMAAAAAARWRGAGAEHIRAALSAFKTLEHRLEKCGQFSGITFYNDSDATMPESTIAALGSFPAPITLIAGGYNKKLELTPLAGAIAEKAEVLITFGASGPSIAQLTREAGLIAGKTLIIREVSSLPEAVESAAELSMPGSTVLFSPACASFDMFENFAERGRIFKKLVAELERSTVSQKADGT